MADQAFLAMLAVAAVLAAASFALCLYWPRVGFVLSFLFAAVIAAQAIVIEPTDRGLSGVAPGLAILSEVASLLAVLIARYPEGGATWPRTAAKVFFGLLGFVALLAGAFVVMGPVGELAVIFAGAGLIAYFLIVRNARTTHLFSTLAAAMRQALPLTATLEIEASAAAGKLGRMLRGVNRWLQQGLSLSDALRRGYPQCPGFALAEVAVGEEMRQLPQAMERIVGQLQRRGREMGQVQPVNPVYPFVVVFAICLFTGGLAVFVVPAFTEILRGVGAELPALTRWVFAAAREASRWILPALLLLACVWLYVLFRPRDPDRPKFLSRLGDRAKWRLPAWGWFERNYAVLQTVTYLRLGLRSGQTLDRAIAQACRLDVNLCYRDRLRRWLERVQAGESVSAAALAAGVGPSLAWAFDPVVNPGGAPAALEMLEGAYRSAYSYRAHLCRYVFWPLIILLLAAMVGLVAISVFLALISITEHTMLPVVP